MRRLHTWRTRQVNYDTRDAGESGHAWTPCPRPGEELPGGTEGAKTRAPEPQPKTPREEPRGRPCVAPIGTISGGPSRFARTAGQTSTATPCDNLRILPVAPADVVDRGVPKPRRRSDRPRQQPRSRGENCSAGASEWKPYDPHPGTSIARSAVSSGEGRERYWITLLGQVCGPRRTRGGPPRGARRPSRTAPKGPTGPAIS